MFTEALLTDLYQITMSAGYFDHHRADDTATFDLYFRHNPFKGGYAVAAGLENAIRSVLQIRFGPDDISFLRSQKSASGGALFKPEFLDFLSGFCFRGSIRGIREGTLVFPNEPLLQVRGKLMDCQLVETILLCHVNYQTLVATKAARLWEASNHAPILEFGLRRAQGPDGGLSACRAAFLGGCEATSDVLGAARFGVPVRGTHAHSWVQTFPSELDAFRAYARSFPDSTVLLVDTYDVLRSGVPNAIRVAMELEHQGHRLQGIRIDSGDLAFLSIQSRHMLDEAGLQYVKIVASNDLDEYLIADILTQGGKIDIWGVGTQLVTAGGDGGGALGGVYKLVEHNGQPKIKLSNNPEKMTNPGVKKVVRFFDSDGLMEADALAQVSEIFDHNGEVLIIDPNNPLRRKKLNGSGHVELLQDLVVDGELVYDFPSLEGIREHRVAQLALLHESHKRLHNAHEYKVGLTPWLWRQKEQMLNREMV